MNSRTFAPRNEAHPYIKICCISSIDEAELAIAAGASAIGLVSAMPSGPGVISERLIADIIENTSGRVDTVLLTSHIETDKLIEQHRACPSSILQLVADVSVQTLHSLREKLTGVKLVKVVHIFDEGSISIARSLEPFVDMLLLDSVSRGNATLQLGGTGATHDWSISQRICCAVKVPVLLAGGLRASNVKEALFHVKPLGVDVCSGVRTNDALDNDKLAAFIRAARVEG